MYIHLVVNNISTTELVFNIEPVTNRSDIVTMYNSINLAPFNAKLDKKLLQYRRGRVDRVATRSVALSLRHFLRSR